MREKSERKTSEKPVKVPGKNFDEAVEELAKVIEESRFNYKPKMASSESFRDAKAALRWFASRHTSK